MTRQIVLTGLSHRTAPVEVREQLAINEHSASETVSELLREPGIDEAVVLATCNRVEVVVAGDDARLATRSLHQYLQRRSGASQRWLEEFTYTQHDHDAIRHVFRVSSSLDSLIIGEPQILGQVKAAFHQSRDLGATDTLLNRTFDHAFHVAKRVRNETRIAENAVSISYAAVELARKVFNRLDGKRVLVIGAGKMGTLAVTHLREAGATSVDIANRSLPRAVELANRLGGQAHSLDRLADLLVKADIVITSTGSQHYIITRDLLRDVVARRKYRPLFLVDIAVPRDIDPRCDALQNVYLFDVDDLGKVVEANLAARRSEADRAELIISEEVEHLRRWMATAHAVPTIVALRDSLTGLKESELQRLVRGNQSFSPEQIAVVERFANSLINKILHEPTVALRDAAAHDPGALINAVRTLFRLEEHPETSRAGREAPAPSIPASSAPNPAPSAASAPAASAASGSAPAASASRRDTPTTRQSPADNHALPSYTAATAPTTPPREPRDGDHRADSGQHAAARQADEPTARGEHDPRRKPRMSHT